MGGSSSSSSQQTSSQSSFDGVNSGESAQGGSEIQKGLTNISAGKNIRFDTVSIEAIPQGVYDAFKTLTDLAEHGLNAAQGAFETASATQKGATQPDKDLIDNAANAQKLIIFGVLIVAGILVWKR